MKFIICISAVILLTSCWPSSVGFRDVTYPEEWKEFYVITLENGAANVPLSYPVDLSEDLKDGLQNNTSLLLSKNEDDAQLIIEGKISSFSIQPVALQEGDEAASNRMSVTVNFIIHEKVPNEKDNSFSISRFVDYSSNADYSSVEAGLLEEINAQIVQDLINKLSVNW